MREALTRAIPSRWRRSRQSHAQAAAQRLAGSAEALLMEVADTQCIDVTQAEHDLDRFTRRCAGEWRARLRAELARATGEGDRHAIAVEPSERWHEVAEAAITRRWRPGEGLGAVRASARRIAKIRTAQDAGGAQAEPYGARMLLEAHRLDPSAWTALETCPRWLRAEVVRNATIAHHPPGRWAVEAAWRAAEAWGMPGAQRSGAVERAIARALGGWGWPGVSPPLALVVALAGEDESPEDDEGWAGAMQVWGEIRIGGEGWSPRALRARVRRAAARSGETRDGLQRARALRALERHAKVAGSAAGAALAGMEAEWAKVGAPARAPQLGGRAGGLCWIVTFRGPTDVLSAVLARSAPRGGLARRCERAYMGSAGVQIPVGERRQSMTQKAEDGRGRPGRVKGTMEAAVRAGLGHTPQGPQ